MPHDPQDDWTRPLPRSPRTPRARDGGGAAPRRDEGHYGRGWQGDRSRRDEDDRWEGAGRWDEERWDERSDGDYDTYDTRPLPVAPPRRSRGRGGGGRPPRRRRRRSGARWLLGLLLLLVLAWVGGLLWAALASWNSIERVAATPPAEGRPANSASRTFLLVGTDGREDLSREERNELVTGHEEGQVRADTIMLLHLPSGDDPVLVSIPRDSYLEVPGYGEEKLNSAYPLGGPELLVQTVEHATGMRVDGYLEIGFGGFVEVVQTVDGVHMCLDEAVQDEKTRLQLEAGCQDLAGTEALKYVRMRYSDPRGDLGRVERQRQFLAALVKEMASPATVLVPWRLHQVGTATGSAMSIGEDTSMLETARMGLGMRAISNGEGESVTVPVADPNYQTHAGSSVLWDEQGAAELFEALRTGAPLSVEP